MPFAFTAISMSNRDTRTKRPSIVPSAPRPLRSVVLGDKSQSQDSSTTRSKFPRRPGEASSPIIIQHIKVRTVSSATSIITSTVSTFSSRTNPTRPRPVSKSRARKAGKSALALRQLIVPHHGTPSLAVSLTVVDGSRASTGLKFGGSRSRLGKSKSKNTAMPLREKDIDRLRNQLLKSDEAGLIIAHARSLSLTAPVGGEGPDDVAGTRKNDLDRSSRGSGSTASGGGAEPMRAVCLDCNEQEAEHLILSAQKTEKLRREREAHLDFHRYSTIESPPPQPPRLPVLLSLLDGFTRAFDEQNFVGQVVQGEFGDPEPIESLMPLGLFMPASAMSLHRPLAGALPSADTLRRGFAALINAEAKVYLYEGPSHQGIHPPLDRISVYTYWWGFELALPPPTMEYLSRVKAISISLLNLLSVIVYAVPGGTRELAPFVGVLSRYIESEWSQLKAQDGGKGVVCGATWFIPAAIVARPWDFDELSRISGMTNSKAVDSAGKGN